MRLRKPTGGEVPDAVRESGPRTTRRRRIRLAVVGVLAVAVIPVATVAPAANGVPQPYEVDSSADIAINVREDGTLMVEETLRLEFTVYDQEQGDSMPFDFHGAVHQGFRLPSVGDFPIPPYLRPEWSDPTLAATGQEGRIRGNVKRPGHALIFDASGTYGPGRHSARITYRITGAARTVDDTVLLHFRPLTGLPVATVAIEGPGLRAARCVTVPPESTPCAEANGGHLEINLDQANPAEEGERDGADETGQDPRDRTGQDAGKDRTGQKAPLPPSGWGQDGNRSAELVVEADSQPYNLRAPVVDTGVPAK